MNNNNHMQPTESDPLRENIKVSARRLAKHCAAYRGADTKRSYVQLIATIIPLFALTAAMLFAVEHDYWAGILLTIPAGGFLVRLFIIQHDCGHGSYFNSRRANNRLGRLISILTLTPYSLWMTSHAKHHATSGNLDKRGFGDIDTLTVAEYKVLPPLKRLRYRLYRNPLVFLVFGAPFHFIIGQRIPFGMALPFAKAWRSVLLSNLALAGFYGMMMALFGLNAVLLVYLPITVMAAWIGGWLFFIQHQFPNTHWAIEDDWDFHSAAILGSSHYVLPSALQWLTGNIGLHHIHHLCGTIPFYRLKDCLDSSPELQGLSRLTVWESLKSVRLVLWDEQTGRLISFSELKTV